MEAREGADWLIGARRTAHGAQCSSIQRSKGADARGPLVSHYRANGPRLEWLTQPLPVTITPIIQVLLRFRAYHGVVVSRQLNGLPACTPSLLTNDGYLSDGARLAKQWYGNLNTQ